MKRLWVRLSAVAAVVASLGGGGYYFVNSGSSANASGGTEVAEGGDPEAKETITPLSDGDGSSAAGSASASIGDLNAGQTPPAEPAQASWREDASQPIIRQVSSNESPGGYGDTEYGAGVAPPPTDPASAYAADVAAGGEARYEDTSAPAPAYGSSPAYGGSTDYGAPADYGAPVDNGASYPSTAETAGGAAGEYGAQGSYDAPPIPPAVAVQDQQPVTAPSFASGEPVGAGSLTREPVAPPADTAPPAVAVPSGGVAFDPAPSPQFDPSPAPAAPVREMPTQPSFSGQPSAGPAFQPEPPAIAAASAALVAATPGARSLEGRQAPALAVEKTAPAEIQVGKPAAFKTLVRNTGEVVAKNVVINDRVPQGTQLIDATPQPSQGPDGSLVWQFESLAPGEEVLISMEVMPQVEGELGNKALVTFQAQASVRTVCTKPQLLVEHSTDPKVLIGDDVVFDITVSNPGSGDATGIVLEEDVPAGLSHVAGSELELEIGTLRAGESRRIELVLKASEAGVTSNKLRVRGDANLQAEHATQLEVIAPKLMVGMAGPRRRYLDRQVKYQVAFGNAGTAIARNVELATYLPKGLQFVSTSGKGQYDARDHAVYWSLDQLAPGQEGAVELVATPVAVGEQKLQIEGTADLGQAHQYEHVTIVEAITELVFSVADTQDPIEVGSETTYEIRIVNNGSKTATNVQMAARMPAELSPLSGEGTTRVAVQGQDVFMEPLDRLGPGDEAAYKIKVKGQRAGDHIIDVRLVSDEVPTPVTKQESTKVYADGL